MLGITLQIWLTALALLITLAYVARETYKLLRKKKRADRCATCSISNCTRRE